jgi:hypothetical protein
MVLGRATSNPSNWRINNKWPPDFATGKYESTLKITAIGAPFSIALAVLDAATVCPLAGGLELPPMLGKIRSVAGVVPVVPAAAPIWVSADIGEPGPIWRSPKKAEGSSRAM